MTFLSIAGGIVSLAIPILKWFLERSNATTEQKKAFFEWVKKAGEDFGSVKLKTMAETQLKWFAENEFKETP